MSNDKMARINLIRYKNQAPSPAHPSSKWIIVAAGAILAVGLWVFLSGFISCWQVTRCRGMPLPSCSASKPLAPWRRFPAAPRWPNGYPHRERPQIAMPPAWDGASRVNVLILGLRGGSNQDCPDCTDTMIVLTIDPGQQDRRDDFHPAGYVGQHPWLQLTTASMQAYTTGELFKLPGGGPALTIKTVEDFLGIPIQYYAQIDFTAFEKMIDDIGGSA